MLTQQRLKELLSYNSKTGIFLWITVPKHCGGRISVGDIAGHQHHRGSHRIMIDGKDYASHRLAWLYVYGKFPRKMLDHRDRNKSNNAIHNLREATNGQNRANSKANRKTKTGLKGVVFNKKWGKIRPYRAQITTKGKTICLGYFSSAQEAHEAYCKKAREIHGEFFHSG